MVIVTMTIGRLQTNLAVVKPVKKLLREKARKRILQTNAKPP